MNRDGASGEILVNQKGIRAIAANALWFRILVFLQISDMLAAQHAERYATTGVEARG